MVPHSTSSYLCVGPTGGISVQKPLSSLLALDISGKQQRKIFILFLDDRKCKSIKKKLMSQKHVFVVTIHPRRMGNGQEQV